MRARTYSRRDFSFGSFSDDPYAEREDADPRVGLVNLADIMLVLACGFMVALVVRYGVNLSASSEVSVQAEMSEIDQSTIDALADQMENGSGSNYTERGMVYEDPTTGQLYMIEEDYDSIGAEGAAESEGNSDADGAGEVANGGE